MAKKKIRVRCPLCGMLVWQSRLNKDFPLEFVLQESSGKGYKKIEHKYKRMRIPDSDGGKLFCTVLAAKMVEKAKEIIKAVGADEIMEINLNWLGEIEPEEESGEWEDEVEEEFEPSVTTYEIAFDEGVAEVEVPVVVEGELKKRSLLGRLFSRSDGVVIEDMEDIAPDLEHVFGDYDTEVVYDE